MIDKEYLQSQAAIYGISLTPAMLDRLDTYARLLVEWNEKVNLTAITEPRDIVTKHFIDSLTVCRHLPTGPISLIDVGTGAGFPGVPLVIYRDDIRLTLLDSLNKRLVFLDELCKAIGVRATLIHARAEEAGQKAELREQYDVATARAVAGLNVLGEYCLPLVKVGGRFIAMKGPDGEEEAKAAKKGIHLLGGKLASIDKLQLVTGSEVMERQLLVLDKKSSTPPEYPRISAKIKKCPL